MAKQRHITAAKRHSLPSSDFVFPEKEAYPVDTKGRARNALARGAQNASPAELAKIKRKVHSKYPGIDIAKKRGGPVVMGEGEAPRHRADRPARKG